jgi:mycoredoxin
MKTITFLLLATVAGGTLQNRDKISHWLNPPPVIAHVAGNYDVVLYTTTWCGYCAKTRKFLSDNHIRYTDFDVEHSEKGRKDYQRLGGNGIPIVVINGDTVIHGYSPEKISEALEALNDTGSS